MSQRDVMKTIHQLVAEQQAQLLSIFVPPARLPEDDRQAVLDDYYEAEKADAQSGREEDDDEEDDE